MGGILKSKPFALTKPIEEVECLMERQRLYFIQMRQSTKIELYLDTLRRFSNAAGESRGDWGDGAV